MRAGIPALRLTSNGGANSGGASDDGASPNDDGANSNDGGGATPMTSPPAPVAAPPGPMPHILVRWRYGRRGDRSKVGLLQLCQCITKIS